MCWSAVWRAAQAAGLRIRSRRRHYTVQQFERVTEARHPEFLAFPLMFSLDIAGSRKGVPPLGAGNAPRLGKENPGELIQIHNAAATLDPMRLGGVPPRNHYHRHRLAF
jgi:hypothetical protein